MPNTSAYKAVTYPYTLSGLYYHILRYLNILCNIPSVFPIENDGDHFDAWVNPTTG